MESTQNHVNKVNAKQRTNSQRQTQNTRNMTKGKGPGVTGGQA